MVDDDWRKDPNAYRPSPGSRSSHATLGDVTQILSAIELGDGQAWEELLRLVYHCPCQAGIAKSVQTLAEEDHAIQAF